MSFQGTVTRWDHDRGFGFITPASGGQDVFAHISVFEGQTTRPAVGQNVSFEIEVRQDGKKRAKRVLPAHFAAPYRVQKAGFYKPHQTSRRSKSPVNGTRSGWAEGLVAITLITLLIGGGVMFWRLPVWIAYVYMVASVICFVAYAVDKHEAINRRWRTPEASLLVLGLLCGWPGAVLAQQILRHKSAKASFQSMFRASVVVNVVVLVAVASLLVLKALAEIAK